MKQTELNKFLGKALKSAGKVYGWRSAGGFLFKPLDELFFSLTFASSARAHSLHYTLRFKWRLLDDMQWLVLGMSDNSNGPMSLRANGAFSVRGQELFGESVRECIWSEEWVDHNITRIVEEANEKVKVTSQQITSIDDFMAFAEEEHLRLLQRSPKAVVTLWRERLLTHLIKNQFTEAAAIAEQRIAARDSGSFIVDGHSFFELARRHISAIA